LGGGIIELKSKNSNTNLNSSGGILKNIKNPKEWNGLKPHSNSKESHQFPPDLSGGILKNIKNPKNGMG